MLASLWKCTLHPGGVSVRMCLAHLKGRRGEEKGRVRKRGRGETEFRGGTAGLSLWTDRWKAFGKLK